MRIINHGVCVASVAPLSILSSIALVQSKSAGHEEVVVTGTRATLQNIIEFKRSSTTLVDRLFATDIGDLPALSIGDAPESITGATSHRENCGATKISIRGLRPYLGTTACNGRMATKGTGRSRTDWQTGEATDVDPFNAMTAMVS